MFKKGLFSKKRILRFGGLCLLATLSLPFYVKYTVKHKIFVHINEINHQKFAIVLGAAVKDEHQPSIYLKYRLDDAITLYQFGKIKQILISGNEAKNEVSVMNDYLVRNGIPQHIIWKDNAGFDTYSTMKRASEEFAIKNAIIVSQGFHLPRSLYIAQKKGLNVSGYATRQNFGKRRYFLREYLATIKAFFDCARDRKLESE